MVRLNPDGCAELVNSPASGINRRQDVPEVFDMTTIAYALAPEFILSKDNLFMGKVKAIHVPRERSVDIDTLLDFEMAEFLMRKKNKERLL